MPFTAPPPFAAFEHRDVAVGFEVVFFRPTPDGVVVDGHTTALEEGEPYAVAYTIELDAHWHTRRAHVRGQSSQGRHETRIEADGEGRWTIDGTRVPELTGCLDVDLEPSSLTNAFPVRRLALDVGQRSAAPAAYVRALDLRVERLEQSYARPRRRGGRPPAVRLCLPAVRHPLPARVRRQRHRPCLPGTGGPTPVAPC